ncbi:MAG TPA: uroporphyrinogen decarboxylase [Chthoniobacterales bacterium]
MHSTIKSASRSKPGKRDHSRKSSAKPGLTNRQRFLEAAGCRPVDRPPVWLMRQAGRVLPEYRALREKHSFLELVQTPELAAEVTLQPIRRFDFDVAVMFSDILVIPEAMGQGYHFRDAGGVEMDFYLRTAQDIDRLTTGAIVERLQYVVRALRLIKSELAGRTALLGFAGSPWTLANFMLAGGGAEQHGRGLELFRQDPALFETLCAKLTEAIGIYLGMQIDAGVDAVQIFDSHGGLAPAQDFEALSGRWITQIVSALGGRVPVIVFSKGANASWKELIATGANVLGVDWNVRLGEWRRRLPKDVGIQGNLNPSLLVHATAREIAVATTRLLTEMRGRPGYIFNLGHGVPPAARLEAIQSLVDTVRNFL